MCVCAHTHTRSENSRASLTSLLSSCGSWGLNWVIRFGGKQLYYLSLSASTFCVLLLDELPIKLSLQDLFTSNHWTETSGAMLAMGWKCSISLLAGGKASSRHHTGVWELWLFHKLPYWVEEFPVYFWFSEFFSFNYKGK